MQANKIATAALSKNDEGRRKELKDKEKKLVCSRNPEMVW
jgi:hypothetical protein